MNDNYMIINGIRYPVINSWVEVESPSDGRRRWGIVTETGTEVPTTGAEEQQAPHPAAPAEATEPNTLFATCTPNSMPQAGHVEFGYELNVMNDQLELLATLDLPDWHKFRPASAGHRLVEMGYMIHPNARNPERVNGWSEVPPFGSWMTRVVRLDAQGLPTEAELADRIFGAGTAEQLAERNAPIGEAQAIERARAVWPEAEGFLPTTRGWTFRVGGGYASVTAAGVVAREPQGTRFDAVSYMGRRTPPAGN